MTIMDLEISKVSLYFIISFINIFGDVFIELILIHVVSDFNEAKIQLAFDDVSI